MRLVRRPRRWLTFTIALLVCQGVARGQVKPGATAAASLQKAVQLTQQHRYAEAEKTLKGVPPPEPLNQRIAFYRLRAAIASGLGRPLDAASEMEKASGLAPRDLQLQIAAEVARLEAQIAAREDPSKTLQSLRSHALSPEQQFELRVRLSEILVAAKLYPQAIEDLQAACKLAPSRANLYYNLALAQFHAGRLDDALQSAGRSQTIQDSASLQSLIGDIQEQRGDPLSAVHAYQAAVALAPSEERYRLALGVELLRHQTFDAAQLVFEQASGQFPESVRVKVLLGLTYFLRDQTQTAVQTLLEASRLAPDDEIPVRYLGEVTVQDATVPQPAAIQQLCSFADAHPRSELGQAYCGAALSRVARNSSDEAKMAEAIQRLTRAVARGSTNPVARCELGKALEWTQQWQLARPQMEACVRLQPDLPEAHYRLSRIYMRLGQVALAKQQLVLQKQAEQRVIHDSESRAKTVSKFLVILGQ